MSHQNPFPGLRSFDYEESHLFFGREKHISDLLRKLDQNHFVAIVGTSGSGKSSLVRAGLLPSIKNGKLSTDGTHWLISTMKPGNTPISNLASSLLSQNVFGSQDASINTEKLQRIDKLLRASSLGLVQSVRNLLSPNQKLLILLDQFEETFRFSGDGMERNDEECAHYVNLIIDAVRQYDVPIYVILTIRSDFLGDCARFEGLPEAINDGHYLVPRLNGEQNKLVITGPVNYAQGKISPRLVQQVINDLGDNPDQLPVLQHALMRTWDKWTETAEVGEPMDIRHYEMTGTMSNALSNHADEAYNELNGDKQKKTIEIIFKCLTVKTGENRGVRRPTAIKHLMEICDATFDEIKEVLLPFRKNGRTFILPSQEVGVTENTVVDISHESLMRAWGRLKIWVDEEMESALIYERLCQSALLHQQGKAALWRDPELQVGLDWNSKLHPNIAWAFQYNQHFNTALKFLTDSNVENFAETKRKRKRTNIIRGAVAIFLVVVTILSAWALMQTKEAKTQTVLADKNRIEAEQKAQEAINQKQLAEKAKEMALDASKQAMDAKSFAELQSNIAGEQTKLAEQQKSKAEEEALRATQQQQLALQQKKLAEQKSAEALSEKQKADNANSETERLRLISISQNIAFKSLQEKNDVQLSGLLAYQAYKFSSDNKGNLNDAQLYNALITSAQKIDLNFKSVVIKETEVSNAISVSGKSITTLMENNSIKNFSTENYALLNQNKLSGLTANNNTSYLSDDGKFAAIGMDNNAVAIYDAKNVAQPKILTGHDGLIRAVAFSSDGGTIATGGRDSNVIIWKNYSLLIKIKCSSRVKAIAFSSDNSKIYAGSEDGKVVQMDADGSDVRPFASANARVQAIKSNGKLIAIGYSNGSILLMNSSGQTIRTINDAASADFISLDEKNDFLAVGLSSKLIHVYHLSETGKPIEIICNTVITALDMNSDFIYASGGDNTIRCYPIKTSYFEKIFEQNLKRNLTKEEWNQYIGSDVPYEK